MPQQDCITHLCSIASTLNCYFYFFFTLFRNLTAHTETTTPLNNQSQCTPYSLIFAAFCISSVCWNDCPTFENATSTLLLFVKSIWNSVEASPPTACTRSLSSERRQCERYNTGSFGVENGVFLIFCLVQLPCSELGWQLECCYTLHASVKPGYSFTTHSLF